MSEFHKKKIEVTVSFNGASEGAAASYGETKTYSGLHISAHIEILSDNNHSKATVRIYGMSHNDMNRLTVVGQINQANRFNKIQISAGDDGGLMQVVHTGYIDVGFINSQRQPSRAFEITSFTALAEQMTAVKATSYKGIKQASDILSDLANEAKLKFVDKGIGQKPLDNAYFAGDAISKIHACADAVGIRHDINNGVLTVWGGGTEKKGGVTVSAEQGNVPLMIGTPSCSGAFLTVATQFFTGFNLHEQVKVKSDYNKPATGMWLPAIITHDIECMNPHGSSAWRTTIECNRGLSNG
jgi:hypothetical protein